MCNGTCDLCGKNAEGLIEIGNVLSCVSVETCSNNEEIRTLTPWQYNNKAYTRSDCFGNVHAKIEFYNTTYHCFVYRDNDVVLYTNKVLKASATLWCDSVLSAGWKLS